MQRQRHPALAILCAVWLGLCASPATSAAQVRISPSDSAAVLYGAARQMELEGRPTQAHDLLRYLIQHFPDTPAARDALDLLASARRPELARDGRSGLTVSSTLFGAWLGVAIPAALGAETPQPYGIGLLIGAPAGFIGSRLYTRRYPVSAGQALTTALGGWWGTFQGIGWREVLDIGSQTETFCYDDGAQEQCYTVETEPSEAPFAAAVIGGFTGLVAGAAVAQKLEPSAGAATMAQLGSLWGAWYGIGAAILTDAEPGDARLAWSLIGSNLGLVASALAAGPADIGPGRAWLISAAGLAGGVAGLGIDLMLQVNDAQEGIVAPLLGSLGGLALGFALTDGSTAGDAQLFNRTTSGALLDFSGGVLTVGPVIPTPSLRRATDGAAPRARLAFDIPVAAARF